MSMNFYIYSLYRPNNGRIWPKFAYAVKMRDEALDQAARDKWQMEVMRLYNAMHSRGFFQDNYNATCLFWRLGLYWSEIKRNFVDSAGYISPSQTQKLLAIIKERTIPPLKSKLELGKYIVVDDNINSLVNWRRYFVNKRRRLIRFLETAIRLNEPIACSDEL